MSLAFSRAIILNTNINNSDDDGDNDNNNQKTTDKWIGTRAHFMICIFRTKLLEKSVVIIYAQNAGEQNIYRTRLFFHFADDVCALVK